MERKNLGIIGGLAAAAGITLAAGNARAERFLVERTEPREHLAEIMSVEGPSVVWRQIDATRKSAKITASPGSPVNVQVGCPSDWKLNVGTEPAATAEHGVAHSTLPGTGVHNAALFASVRVGETRIARLECVRMEAGTDGKPGTADDIIGDREKLSVEVTAVAGAPSADHDPFVYRDEAPLDTGVSGMPVELSAAVVNNVPLVADPSQNIGGLFQVQVDPVAKGWAGRVPIGLTYRVGKVHETVTGVDGNDNDVSGIAHCGFVGGGWSPILAERVIDVRVDVEAALGVCRSTEIDTGPGTSVPGVTDVAGRFGAGLSAGGKNLAGRIGVDFVVADEDSLQNWGPNVGIVARF